MNDQMFHHGRQGLLLPGLALLFGLATLALTLGNGWHAGFQTAQMLGAGLPPWLWESLTTVGDERVLLALMLPFCLRYPRIFWTVVVASLLATLLCRGIKFWFPMPRPAAVLDAGEITVIGPHLMLHSFVSGHTASIFACVGVWLLHPGRRLTLPLLGLACLGGFSRIAVGAHWPVDVLAGAALGVLAAWSARELTRSFRWGLRARVHWGMVLIAALAVATLPFDGQGYPGSLPWRIAVCLWGLTGFYVHYLQPALRHGWAVASRPNAQVWATATKA